MTHLVALLHMILALGQAGIVLGILVNWAGLVVLVLSPERIVPLGALVLGAKNVLEVGVVLRVGKALNGLPVSIDPVGGLADGDRDGTGRLPDLKGLGSSS